MAKPSRGAAIAGLVLIGGAIASAAAVLIKDKSVATSAYTVSVGDGAFEIRDYPALLVATTTVAGDRRSAQSTGFTILADYIFAKSRSGAKIAMTAPVIAERATTLVGDASGDKGDDEGWRIAFVMPAGHTHATLPKPPAGVHIADIPARRVAAVRFPGTASDDQLHDCACALRAWLERRGETSAGHAEYAFYDAPFIPGPLRRNEVLIALG